MCIEDEPKAIQALPFFRDYSRTREGRSGVEGAGSAVARSAALPLLRGLCGIIPPHARPLSDAVGGLRAIGGFLHHDHRQAQILGVQFISQSVE